MLALHDSITSDSLEDAQALEPRFAHATSLLGARSLPQVDIEIGLIGEWRKLLASARTLKAKLADWRATHDVDPQAGAVAQAITNCETIRANAGVVTENLLEPSMGLLTEATATYDGLPAAAGGARAPSAGGGPIRWVGVRADALAAFASRFRKVVYWLAVPALAIAGLSELWAANTTFGSAGLADYLTLAVWGFGSERVVGALTQPKTGG